jgi:hypothetical protein
LRPFCVVSLSVNSVGELSESRSNSPATSMKTVDKFLDTKSQLNPVLIRICWRVCWFSHGLDHTVISSDGLYVTN